MSTSQEVALCNKGDFESIHSFEHNVNHRSYSDQVSLENYAIQHQISQNTVATNAYETMHVQEYAQTMYYDNADSHSYFHTAHPHNTLNMHVHGAYYHPQGMQMTTNMMNHSPSFPSWQGDWVSVWFIRRSQNNHCLIRIHCP